MLGAEFVPTLDEGALAIQAVRLPSVSLEEAVEATTRIEKTLLDEFPDENCGALQRRDPNAHGQEQIGKS